MTDDMILMDEVDTGKGKRQQILIEGLFRYARDLREKLSEKESELEKERDLAISNGDRLKEAEDQVLRLEGEKATYMFTSVLIDGTALPFADQFVKLGAVGGRKAASQLSLAVKQNTKSSALRKPGYGMQIKVHIYANLEELAKWYIRRRVLAQPSQLYDFVRGFNLSPEMFDFVDVGKGKQNSDKRVRETFKLHLADVHCHQLFLACSAHSGYASLLTPYARDETARHRITIIEGVRLAPSFDWIRTRLRVIPVSPIFWSRVSPSITPPAAPDPGVDTTVDAENSTPYIQPPSSPRLVAHFMRPLSPAVPRNKFGQRVDTPTRPLAPLGMMEAMRARKLCARFYLVEKCRPPSASIRCPYVHDYKIHESQLPVLRAVARTTPCPEGLYCDDPNCVFGHNCPRQCTWLLCGFPQEMHNVDTVVVPGAKNPNTQD